MSRKDKNGLIFKFESRPSFLDIIKGHINLPFRDSRFSLLLLIISIVGGTYLALNVLMRLHNVAGLIGLNSSNFILWLGVFAMVIFIGSQIFALIFSFFNIYIFQSGIDTTLVLEKGIETFVFKQKIHIPYEKLSSVRIYGDTIYLYVKLKHSFLVSNIIIYNIDLEKDKEGIQYLKDKINLS